MKIDLLLSWPRNCDYPLYRQYIINNRSRWNQVIIAFTESFQGEDYRSFIEESLWNYGITFVQPMPNLADDWRNVSTNAMIRNSSAEWVYFSEQDFYISDDIWNQLLNFTKSHDVIGFKDGDSRFHPASLLIKRNVLELTSKNFGIVEGVSDHFSRIYNDLDGLAISMLNLPQLADFHMNGLSHNLTLLYRGEEIYYKPEEFKAYLADTLKASVPLDPRYKALVERYLQ